MRGLLLCALLICATSPLAAHMMSMSTGELLVRGDRVEYALRVPIYEIGHLQEPEKTLFANFHVYDGTKEATLTKHLCDADPGEGSYICRAEYQFPAPVQDLQVACTFASVTVPNHVHLLRAERDGVWDQAIFDLSLTRTSLRFQPPGQTEMALSQIGAGMKRAAGGWAQLLFLLALAMAARSRRELYLLAGSFLAAECLAALYINYGEWTPAARFVEAAAALTVAYLAVEILLLPDAAHRWAVAGALGVFHGFYFGLFLRESQYHPLPVLAGVVVTEAALLALFAWLLSRIERFAAALRPVRVGAGALLAVGLAWFFLRMRG
jgi:hypothetical protein